MSIRVEGLQEVQRDLGRLGVATSDLQAFGVIGAGIVSAAQGRISVLTGAARATIRIERDQANELIVSAGSPTVDYAGILNYVRPGNAFLTAPANEGTDQKVRQLESNIDQLITKYRLR